MKFLNKFENHTDYEAYLVGSEITKTESKPIVSFCKLQNEVHYNKYVPPFFCKLTLNDDNVVELEGSGQLTSTMIQDYSSTLVSIETGELCTSIGNGALQNCTDLTNVTISDSVTSIGNNAFKGCSGLTSIIIPDSVTSIDYGAFSNCSNLISVTIPNNVTSIGKDAFSYCNGLTSIIIPDNVTSIGENAFSHCSSLTSVIIPDSVTSIGNMAFVVCSNLTDVIIGSGVTTIGNGIFDWTPFWNTYLKDTSNHYGNIIYINDVAYVATSKSITSATFKSGTISIGYSAFKNCTNLTSINNIPDSVTSICQEAFSGCSGLTDVIIGSGVTNIGQFAFNGCTGLTSITIPDSVTVIDNYAFQNCNGLTSVTIGNGVTSIGNSTFYNCSNLTNIVSNAMTAPTIRTSTFNGVNTDGTLTVPSGSTGYDVWMGTGDYYLGKYGWTKVEQQ